LHMAQLMPLPPTVSCSVKSRLVLPFWYRLTQIVLEKRPLNGSSSSSCLLDCLQCFDAVGWAAGRASGLSGGVLAWLSVWSEVPLTLTVSCFSKIQIGFTFMVLAHPGSPGQRAIKRAWVCVANIVCRNRSETVRCSVRYISIRGQPSRMQVCNSFCLIAC